MITTVVVARRAEASAVAGHPAPDQQWPGFTSRLVDSVSLATVASIAATGNADDEFERFLADVDFLEQTDERAEAAIESARALATHAALARANGRVLVVKIEL